LPARCCQPAVSGGFIYADLRGELSTHLAPQALFTQSSPVRDATATSFPLSKHTGGGHTAPAFSGLPVFIYSSHGKWVFPPLLWSFPPTALLQAFPLLIAWRVPPLLPSLVRLFIYSSLRDFPSPPLWLSGCPALFAMCLFCCYCLLFSFFPLGGGSSVQRAMVIWPRVVCGSTAYRLAHLVVCIFPSHLGTGVWQRRSPPGFSV
jgi:hypothetical protein